MVNKTKHKLGLASGIMSIIAGALILISSIIALATLKAFNAIGVSSRGLIIAGLISILVLGIVSIILGAMLCRKPQETGFGINYFKGIKIGLLIVMAILFVLEILVVGGFFMILDLIIIAAIIALLIASLCVKDTADSNNGSYNR